MAALLYLGSGIGMTLYRLVRAAPSARLRQGEWPWLAGAIFTGGVLGPGLQMLGLTHMPASGASLLLNAESVFTALLAWFVFKENYDKRIALGMGTILSGLLILSGRERQSSRVSYPRCACCGLVSAGRWIILTRKVSLSDATWFASLKGLVAGAVNIVLAFALGAKLPSLPHVAGSMLVGLFAYGASLVLFVIGLSHFGTARTGAYYSVAPFFGAEPCIRIHIVMSPLRTHTNIIPMPIISTATSKAETTEFGRLRDMSPGIIR
jgi:drug/metabolite transporter (DMT)-like permease